MFRSALTTAAAAVLLATGPGAAAAPGNPDVQRLRAHGIDTARLAAGWEVRGDFVVWDGGAVMTSIQPMAFEDCSQNYVCFWADKSYGGRLLQFQASGLRGDMRDYGFNDQMSSWRSRRSVDARWYYNYDGSGTSRCMESYSSNGDVGAGAWNNDNDEMSSFRIYASDGRC